MHVITARNPHQALMKAMMCLSEIGVQRDSRNGPVLQAPAPVSTTYTNPRERVIFHPWRDANPFFHAYEVCWMFAGRHDVAPLVKYAKQMSEYADQDGTLNAAYGFRWRNAWNTRDDGYVDQLSKIIHILAKDPSSRQAYLQIWDHTDDLDTDAKDKACNTGATFQTNHVGELCLVVFCRSNDIIWGCYGANAVHFSALLEYVATCSGLPIGAYTQISVNWHGYRKVFDPMLKKCLEQDEVIISNPYHNPYVSGVAKPFPMITVGRDRWDEECRTFVSDDGRLPQNTSRRWFNDPFFSEVMWPIVAAHDAYKDGNMTAARRAIAECQASDWKLACQEWLERRQTQKRQYHADPTEPVFEDGRTLQQVKDEGCGDPL